MIFMFLLYKNIVPWGRFRVEYKFSKQAHPFFSVLRPNERVGNIAAMDEGNYQIIKKEPVYFDIETPRKFKNVLMDIEYKFSEWQRKDYDFKIGLLADKNNWQFTLEPLENSKMSRLLNDWDNFRQGNTVFMQGIRRYGSIEEFLNNLPNRENFAVYNYELDGELKLADYKGQNEDLEIGSILKGYHQFYTYVKDEPLEFVFEFECKDARQAGGVVNLYYGKSLVLTENLWQEERCLDKASLVKENLREGVYKIEIKINDDVAIKKIKTKQEFLSFINKVNFKEIKDGYKPVELYTNSETLKAASSIKEGLQDIKAGDNTYGLNELFKQFLFDKYSRDNFFMFGQKNSLAKISLKRDNIIIQGAGLFSFSKESFINPGISSLENMEDFSDLQYVIAEYDEPEVLKDGWKSAKALFDLQDIARDRNKYNFILSISGIEELHIRKIRGEFR